LHSLPIRNQLCVGQRLREQHFQYGLPEHIGILAVVVAKLKTPYPSSIALSRRASGRRRNHRVIGGCLLVYFEHGRRRHRPRRGDGQPQGSRTAHKGNPEPHALTGHDRWRELPRPSYTPFYGARYDRSRIPRGPASEGYLASRRFNDATSEIFLKKQSEMRVVAAVP
jgi:hypothetical protein